MLPIIPILGFGALLSSFGVLWWYESLSAEDKTRYDSLAASYALSMFQKAVSELTRVEAQHVHNRVKAHFTD